jgi:mono/diheme cytochrome c family protein
MNIKLISLLVVAMAALISLSFVNGDQDTKPWPVPDMYKAMKNPVKFDQSAAAALWSKHCKSCHGKEGLGDGPKAAQLDTPSGDFTLPGFQKQSDGALFYKTLEGRDDMPSYKKKIPDENEIWQLVHYMRTFE